MNLIDKFSLKLLKKLANIKECTFKELGMAIKNKKTLSNRLKYLQDNDIISKDRYFYRLTEKGRDILRLLIEIEKIISKEDILENLDAIPSYFQSYLFNFLSELRREFKETLLSVILFGSVARGKWTRNSDLDLFIILSNEYQDKYELNEKLIELIINFQELEIKNKLKKDKFIHSIQAIAVRLIDLNYFRTLFYDIAMDGIIIFDKDQTGEKFIERIKHRMKENQLTRVYNDDHDFYWKHEKVKFGELKEL